MKLRVESKMTETTGVVVRRTRKSRKVRKVRTRNEDLACGVTASSYAIPEPIFQNSPQLSAGSGRVASWATT